MKRKAIVIALMLSLVSMGGMAQTYLSKTTGWSMVEEENTQEVTEANLRRSITFQNDSETEEVIVEITEGTLRVKMDISSTIFEGKLSIELYNPEGKLQGKFAIGTQLKSSKREEVLGQIERQFKEPQIGKWKVRIIPEKATGKIVISTSSLQ